MRFEILIASFKADMKAFFRSKATLFWTLAFPIMLILIFGAIFSGIGETEFELHVQNLDENDEFGVTEGFLQGLEATGYIKIKNVPKDTDIKSYMDEQDIKRVLVIPEDFSEPIIAQQQDPYSTDTVNLSFYFDQSKITG